MHQVTKLNLEASANVFQYYCLDVHDHNLSALCLQIILSSIGESLPDLLSRNVLKRREVPGFLEEEVRYPKESLACLSHLLFVDHIAVDIFPAVLRWRVTLLTMLIYICIKNEHREKFFADFFFFMFFQSDFCSAMQHGIYWAAVKQVIMELWQ